MTSEEIGAAKLAALAALSGVYARWREIHELDLGSADEHVNDPSILGSERSWLRAFVEVWEAFE